MREVPFVVAMALGLVPLLWLEGLRERGHRRPAAFWWVAAGLGVSFVADVVGALGYAPLASQVYPVLQAALIAVTLLERPAFVAFVAVLLFAASLSIMWRGAGGYDVILRTVAFGGVSVMAWAALPPSTIRATLVVGFAAMLGGWFAYTLDPGWTSWATLQAARLGTTVGFCVAAREGKA